MSLYHINVFIGVIAEMSYCIPLLVLLFCNLIKDSKDFKFIILYLVSSFLIKLLTIILIFGFNITNTLPFYHILSITEFVFIYLFFAFNITLNRITKYSILTIVFLFNIFNTLFLQNLHQFNSYAWTVNTIVLIVMGFVYLVHSYSKEDVINIATYPHFIINAGLLIYLAGSLFTYMLGWYILSRKPEGFFANGWIIQSISSILKNIIIAFGLWTARSR